MLSLIILLILLGVFGVLAVKNWRTSIGAGPTILIVGALLVSVYGTVKYNVYQTKLREYDACKARVDRSRENGKFQLTLVNVIIREFPSRPDIALELQEAMLTPLTLEGDCPGKPSFLSSFTDGV